MVKVLDTGLVKADIMRSPPGAKCFASRRKLANQICEATVVGITASFRTQYSHDLVRYYGPVDEEVGRPGVKEDEPG